MRAAPAFVDGGLPPILVHLCEDVPWGLFFSLDFDEALIPGSDSVMVNCPRWMLPPFVRAREFVDGLDGHLEVHGNLGVGEHSKLLVVVPEVQFIALADLMLSTSFVSAEVWCEDIHAVHSDRM